MEISRKKIHRYYMQLSKKFDISIVIIGFNTYEPLKQLLDSINLIEINKSIEVIYIDDGSTESSFNLFNKYIMNFSTKGHRINKNKGRAFATQKGIAMAQGEWLYFIRSNEIILKNTFSRYFKLISNKEILAVMGVVQYSSQDKQFENYLNSNYRGVSRYISGSLIPYKYLLFNNSIIHHQVFKYITINPRLNQYGGEELDFSFKFNAKYPDQIIACPEAIVLRNNYPTLAQHCDRLFEFGSYNFKLLSSELKTEVVKYKFLLIPVMKHIIETIYLLSNVLYKINWRNKKINYRLIQTIMLCSILRGYHRGS